MKEKDNDSEKIDWSKMCIPQSDQYDTRMILYLAMHGTSPLRKVPYQRRPVEDAPTCCDGTVALRLFPDRVFSTDNVVPAAFDHPNLERGAQFLARWPAAYTQFKTLMDTVYPYSDLGQAKMGAYAFGSSSHSFENEFGGIHVTVDDPIGMAQAMIHEMAHQKLRAMGVSFEVAERLITNPPSERFVSPIRKDKTRPMTAVFHAQYSFMHVTALNLYMLKAAKDEPERTRILMLLGRNVPRMQQGYDVISENITTDTEGSNFVNEFMRWSTDVIAEGYEQLDVHGYGVTS
ncbi:hypothetical protein BH09BAC6_BH09BAC6_33220 [soil metagenome]|jgi:hypothetical protein